MAYPTIALTLTTGALLTFEPEYGMRTEELVCLLGQPGAVLEGRTTNATPLLVPVRSILYAEPAAPDVD